MSECQKCPDSHVTSLASGPNVSHELMLTSALLPLVDTQLAACWRGKEFIYGIYQENWACHRRSHCYCGCCECPDTQKCWTCTIVAMIMKLKCKLQI